MDRPSPHDAPDGTADAAGPSLAPVVRAVLARPTLWPTAARQALRLAPRGWWRHPPFLPVPDPTYLRFRMVTAYGGDGSAPADADDVVTYLRWCRAWPDAAR